MPAALPVAQTITPLLSGAIASLPAAGTAGRGYLSTDAPWLARDSGSAWEYYGPAGYLLRNVAPPATSWSWDNQQSATVDYSAGVLLKTTATTTKFNCLYRSAPGSTPWTLTVGIRPLVYVDGGGYMGFAVGFRGSANSKWHFGMYGRDQGYYSARYTSATTFDTNYLSATGPQPQFAAWPYFWKLKDDGTHRTVSFSYDGLDYYQLDSQLRAADLTPDQIGFGIRNDGSAQTFAARVFHWETT